MSEHAVPRLRVIETLLGLKREADSLRAQMDEVAAETTQLISEGRASEAEERLAGRLSANPHAAELWHQLARARQHSGRMNEAIDAALQAIAVNPAKAAYHRLLGELLPTVPDRSAIILRYAEALGLQPPPGTSQARELDWVEQHCRARAAAEDSARAWLMLGNVMATARREDQATLAYEEAHRRQPGDCTPLENATAVLRNADPMRATLYRAKWLMCSSRHPEAISELQTYLNARPDDRRGYALLAECHQAAGNTERLELTYREAIDRLPGDKRMHRALASFLHREGRTRAAITAARAGLRASPRDGMLRRYADLILPIIYDDELQIERYRARFAERLARIIATNPLNTEAERRYAREVIGAGTTSRLAYQGRDDLPLLLQYGAFVERVMSASYPQWARPRPAPPRSGGRLRIGYLSGSFYHHSTANTTLGWLRHRDRSRFAAHCYYIGTRWDYTTAAFERSSDVFTRVPAELEAVCERVVADDLHCLVFPDLESGFLMQLAGLRLAPVQCTSWGTPVTSGLRTIGYFLSGDGMEPPGAERQYSESLVRLPGIGVPYERPVIPERPLERATLGIRQDAVAYLSCQSLFKYLPRHDYLFPAIAARVPRAQFIFVSAAEHGITERFRTRLSRAFTDAGLSAGDHCIFVPRMHYAEYLRLYRACDVYLDTLEWSGANTTMEAVSAAMPIVTLPGRFMRGRHSYGILSMLGLESLTVSSEAEYVTVAVELGLNAKLRREREELIAQHRELAFDTSSATALAEFYERALDEVATGG